MATEIVKFIASIGGLALFVNFLVEATQKTMGFVLNWGALLDALK